MAAYRIEKALLDATDAAAVTVIGYTGDYGGYYTTEEEYRCQHYEGASMIYGRHATAHVRARHVQLATRSRAFRYASRVVFHAGDPIDGFRPTGIPPETVGRQ